ncbi:hypothetical protein U1Q18_025980 [Sarracenia purpurea var. burkii]
MRTKGMGAYVYVIVSLIHGDEQRFTHTNGTRFKAVNIDSRRATDNVGFTSAKGRSDGAGRASPGSDGGAGGSLEVSTWYPGGGGAAVVYGRGGRINDGGDDAVVGVGTGLRL